MEKNISINISGIIFHIDEEGYARLKAYLESISNYLSSYEDSSEIIADIESRIAEIFLSKLGNGKQVIAIGDVDALMAAMGTTADFEAAEEQETNQSKEQQHTEHTKARRRLVRDEKYRVIGGVAAGIARYFSIDALWVRLLMVLMLLNFFSIEITVTVLLVYIVLWIALPGSRELGENKKVKKMYRDPDNRVLGGVAGSIASFFGVDTNVIRLLFIIGLLLGGAGLILYLILWVITPVANTITEKMQMQGEPVTLANIEQYIKKNLNVREGAEESALVKILLFPFRVIAAVFALLGRSLSPILKFIAEALRVLAGLVTTGVGIGLILVLSTVLGIASDWEYFNWEYFNWEYFNWGYYVETNLPLAILRDSLPTLGYISVFTALFVPALGLAILGISILTKRMVLNAAVGWAMFGLWVLSLIGTAFTLHYVLREFNPMVNT